MSDKVPLREIDKAITLNSVLDQKASKILTLKKWQNGISQGVPRCVFIYIALKAGYSPEEICDYLAINVDEFTAKQAVLPEMYATGLRLFKSSNLDTHTGTYNAQLLFYRKLLLAQNYLRYRCGYGG